MTTSLLLLARKVRVRNLLPIILAMIFAVSFETVNAQNDCGDPLGTAGTTLDPDLVPKFMNNMPVIQDLGLRVDLTKGKVKEITVTMEETTQDLLGMGFDTKVWGYKFPGIGVPTYPGATIVAMEKRPVNILWDNQLVNGHFLPIDGSLHMAHPPALHGDILGILDWYNVEKKVPTVAHLHGGHTESASDGLPEAWFTQGFADQGAYFVKQSYWYDNDQEAGTLWYHDHALGITRLNVYAGLAGFYLLRDENEFEHIKHKVIPSGDYEIEIVIQDRLFDTNGQLFWPALPGETPWDDFITPEAEANFPDGVPPSALAEMFGNIILVNGKAWPKLDVEPRKYRFRLLNGSDSRFYILKLDNGAPLMVIGTDDGFLESPVNVNELVFAPGERYDVVVDFTGMPGANITMLNDGPDEPYGGGVPGIDFDPACPGTTGQIMQFQVTKPLKQGPDATVALGTKLRNKIQPLTTNAPARQLVLFEGEDEYGRLQPMLGTLLDGSKTWFEPITENPDLDAIEEWEVYNATGDAHPIHLHLVSFQIQNRESFVGSVAPRPQIQHSSTEGDYSTYGVGGVLTVDALGGDVTDPLPHENGWKDTFIVLPDQVGRVRAKFDRLGRYVWHCHILSHEDHEMMRPFHVGPMPQPAAARMASNIERNIENVPNPFVYKTQVLFELEKSQNVDFTVYDTQGKLLYHHLNFYREGKNAIFWDGFDNKGKILPTGVYIYRLHGENFQEAKKLVIER